MDKKQKNKFSGFLKTRKLLEMPNVSTSPLDRFKSTKSRLNIFDTELVNLYELTAGAAGAVESEIEPKTGLRMTGGTSTLKIHEMVQFSVLEKSFEPKSSKQILNLFRSPEGLSDNWWEGSKGVQDLIFGRGVTEGKTKAEFEAGVKNYFKSLDPNSRILLMGYNADKADREWLRQFGAELPSNIHYVDMYDIARIAFPKQGYTGGLKLETLKQVILKQDIKGSHTATGDNLTVSQLFDHIMGAHWNTMSSAQQNMIYKHLTPFLQASPAVNSRFGSHTLDFFQSASVDDPYLLRRYKFAKDSVLFRTRSGKPALGTVFHTGSKAGLEHIENLLGQIDDSSVGHFKKLYQNLQSYSDNRLEFLLEKRKGLDYLYLVSTDKGPSAKNRRVLSQVGIPLQQVAATGQKSLVTFGNKAYGVRGRFIEKSGSKFLQRSYTSLMLEAMNQALYPLERGGIVVKDGLNNLNPNFLKAIVANAQRVKMLSPSGDGIDFGSLSRDITGGLLDSRSIGTALTNIGSIQGERSGTVAALENDIQFLLNRDVWHHQGNLSEEVLKQAEIPEFKKLKDIFDNMNIFRSLAVRQGKGAVANSDMPALKEASAAILKLFEHPDLSGLGATFYGIKPEAIFRGIFSSKGGIHSGITKRTGPKGSFELRNINFFSAKAREGIKAASMVPRGLIPGIAGAQRRGLNYVPGRIATLGVITANPSGSAADKLAVMMAAHTYGGDASVLATTSGARKIKSTYTNKSIFVNELHSDVLSKLSREQRQQLRRASGDLRINLVGHSKLDLLDRDPKTKRVIDPNQRIVLGTRIVNGKERPVVLNEHLKSRSKYKLESERLVGITTVKGQRGYYLHLAAPRAEAIGRSIIVGGLRTTISEYQNSETKRGGLFKSADFVGFDEFNSGVDLEYQHKINRITASGKASQFHSFLERELKQKIESFTDSHGQFFFETPSADAATLQAKADVFARRHGIDVNVPIVNLSAAEAKMRGVPVGTPMKLFDVFMHERLGERDDLGKKVGGALRIRLKDATEAQVRATASGYGGISPSSVALRRIFGRYNNAGRHFNDYAKYIASGGTVLPSGIKTYTLEHLRNGALLPINTSGHITRESIKGTIFDKHMNTPFAIDLGADVGVIPIGGKKVNEAGKVTREARAINRRRILLFPSMRMAGFGLSDGSTKISTTDAFGRFAAGINLLMDSSLDPNFAANQFARGYKKFHGGMFGKDKFYEKHGKKTRKIKESAQLRNIKSSLGGDFSGRAVGTVELEEGFIRRNWRDLGLTDDFVKRIKAGQAFGLVTINPHTSLQHSSLVRYQFRKKSRFSFSPSIGTHPFLSKVIRRDYDKDKIFTLFFDQRNKKSRDAFHAALQKEWEHTSSTDYNILSRNMQETLRRQHNIASKKTDIERAFADDGKDLDKALMDLVAFKGLAPSPHLKIKGEELFLSPDDQLAYYKGTPGKDVLKSHLKKKMFTAFNLSGGRKISSNAIDLAATLMDVNAHELNSRYKNWAVFQEELYQQSLQKAGAIKDAAQQFGDVISGLQVEAWDMYKNDRRTSASDVYGHLKKRASTAASQFMDVVQEHKGMLNIGSAVNFEDTGKLIEDFSTNQAMMHLMYGSFGFDLSNGDKSKRDMFLGRSHSARALLKKSAKKDNLDVFLRHEEVIDANFDFNALGTIESQANDQFRSIKGEVKVAAEAAANQMAEGGGRASPFIESIEAAGKKLASAVTQGGSSIIEAISNLPPNAKMGLGLLGGYIAYSQLTAGGVNELAPLSAPDISSSRVMQSSLPKTPIISSQDVRYPDPINPASYRSKAMIQRGSPMIQFHGRQITNNPYGTSMDLADTIGSANVANGQINIYDNRSSSDMQAQFAARDAMVSDY